jgi:hypothetical protein
MNLLDFKLEWTPTEAGAALAVTAERIDRRRFTARMLFPQHQPISDTVKGLRSLADVLEQAERISTP